MTAKLKKIKILVLDVDGVLTDGSIYYDGEGKELKRFNVYDGMALSLLRGADIKSVLVSAKECGPAVRKRARDFGAAGVYQNAGDKLKVYRKILKRFRLKDENICFIGDDLVDLPLMRRAGFSAAVCNACREVRNAADYITRLPGGSGAVREVVEKILKSKRLWAKLIAKYLR